MDKSECLDLYVNVLLRASPRARLRLERHFRKMVDFLESFHFYLSPENVPLVEACAKGEKEIVSLLIEIGSDVNGADISPRPYRFPSVELMHLMLPDIMRGFCVPRRIQTPLCEAALYGHTGVVRILLEAGADPSTPMSDGDTPLIVASMRGRGTIVRMLLNAGADVNAENASGTVALAAAASRSHVNIMRMLVDAGADMSMCGKPTASGVRSFLRKYARRVRILVVWLTRRTDIYVAKMINDMAVPTL